MGSITTAEKQDILKVEELKQVEKKRIEKSNVKMEYFMLNNYLIEPFQIESILFLQENCVRWKVCLKGITMQYVQMNN